MKYRETLDEAIDRVATRMTQGDGVDRAEIQPVWLAAPIRAGFAWRLAGVVGVSVVLSALAVTWMSHVDEPTSESTIAASSMAVWAPLAPAASSGTANRLRQATASLAEALRAEAEAVSSNDRSVHVSPRRSGFEAPRATTVAFAAVDSEARPTWGIPFIEAPAALAIASTTIEQIGVEAVGVDALEIAPLSVSPIDPGIAKEQ